MITKICKDCCSDKPLSEFYPQKGSKDKYSHICKVCNNVRNRKWQQLNKEKCAESSRKYREKNLEYFKKYARETKYKLNYGISLQEWEMLFQSQNKKCAICGDTSKNESKDMCVDHCHKTGKVRAILCRRCNSALGLFKEDKEILQEAIKYIDKNRV